jgi:lipoyl(octanoyl) transferase
LHPRWAWLGRVPYGATAALQERLRQQVAAGVGPETLLLLEHQPVITLGRSADPAHVLAAPDELQRRGITVHHSARGGDVTYHGPGQLVGYPIVRLRAGIVGHMRAMADGLADVLATHGIAARWDREAPGLWVDEAGAPPAKIAAFGVHVRQRVSIHGFALNVASDLDAFRLIVPCGLSDARVTSMKRLLGDGAPAVDALAEEVAHSFACRFGIDFARAERDDLTTPGTFIAQSAS